MLIQGQVGPISTTSSLASGTNAPMRQGNLGEQIVQSLHGKYSEATYRRSVYSVANQSGVTHSAALTTTFVGICVGNPSTSTVNLHIIGFGWSLLVASAASAAIGIMTGSGTIANELTPRNRYVGGTSSRAYATQDDTLPGTPVLDMVVGAVGTVAITSWPPLTNNYIDLSGSIILPPNTFAASYMTTASGASGFIGGFVWEEVPI